MLGNLISNAAKYGEPGGLIRVRLVGADDEVQLSVENAGPGIDISAGALLFQALRRGAAASSQHDRTSLGLGLFIVRQIAHSHGGTVALSSGDGRTVFTVTLPKAHSF